MQRLNNDINIFVVTHKVFKYPKSIDGRIYTPIQVGIGENKGYLRENQLDNISHKNKTFCELTALYFLWKNVKCNYAGLVHYSRFLCTTAANRNILSEGNIRAILSRVDLMLPNKMKLNRTVIEQYTDKHHIQDWEMCRAVITDKYPDYLSSFDNISQSKEIHTGNIMIGKKTVIDEYCEWIFNILFEVEKRIDISSYSSYNQRVFGFLAERLFNVWLLKNSVRFNYQCLPMHSRNSSLIVAASH